VLLATHELGGEGRPLVFVHGNGLHAHTLQPVAAHVTDRRCVGVDLRGFGHSDAPTTESFHWHTHGDDLHETLDAAGLIGADVFGFSMGGASAVIAELRHPHTFGRMVLYEPIIMPPPWDGETPAFDATLRRRFHFESEAAAIERFGSKPPWSTVVPEALEAYVRWGTRPDPDGPGVVLRCDPRHEANNYRAGGSHDTWDHLGAIERSVLVLSGGEGGAAGFASGVAERIPGALFHRFPALAHFGPMQDPAGVAAVARTHVGA